MHNTETLIPKKIDILGSNKIEAVRRAVKMDAFKWDYLGHVEPEAPIRLAVS